MKKLRPIYLLCLAFCFAACSQMDELQFSSSEPVFVETETGETGFMPALIVKYLSKQKIDRNRTDFINLSVGLMMPELFISKANGLKIFGKNKSGITRQSWNDFANIFKANADEIAEAAVKIKNYRTANNLKGGNYGYLEGTVNSRAVDSKMWRSVPMDVAENEIHIFQATEATGVGGTWSRITDSEYRMLNKLADDLGAIKGGNPNIQGELKIVSENPFCTSCQGVIQQFNEMYPNIKLIIIDGVK